MLNKTTNLIALIFLSFSTGCVETNLEEKAEEKTEPSEAQVGEDGDAELEALAEACEGGDEEACEELESYGEEMDDGDVDPFEERCSE